MENFGQRFKHIRTEFGMTQEEFGEHLGLTKASVSAVEKNRSFVSIKVLSKLFFDYNVNLNNLICGEGNFFNSPQFEEVQDELTQKVENILRKNGLIK